MFSLAPKFSEAKEQSGVSPCSRLLKSSAADRPLRCMVLLRRFCSVCINLECMLDFGLGEQA
jgi:hypothetical protein